MGVNLSQEFRYTVEWLIIYQQHLSSMEIGQKVKVLRLRDRVSDGIASKLGKIGVVKEFKMTDGSGVGAIVEFEDKTNTWFFEDELKIVG